MAALAELGLNACIECGCCDYVCPSQILLTDHFVTAKANLREYTDDTIRATRARARFEARETRLEDQQARRTTALEQQTDAKQDMETIEDIMARVESKDSDRKGKR